MNRTKSAPTESREAARASLLAEHTETELSALLVTAELLHRIPGFVRQLLDGVEWVSDVRSRLTHFEDPPRAVLTALALGPITGDDAAEYNDTPEGRTMAAQVNAALQLAESVRRARELLPQTAMFGRGERPAQLRALSRMPPVDLVAVMLVAASKAGFSARFSATEAMAFAVVAEVETPTDDTVQRLNTWSKRLRRLERHVSRWVVDLVRVHLQVVARRVKVLAEVEAVHQRVQTAVTAH